MRTIWKTVKHNGHEFLIVLDQFANVVLGSIFVPHEQSWADETLSSRAYRWSKDGVRKWPETVINALLFWQRDDSRGAKHCQLAFENERHGHQLPPEARAGCDCDNKEDAYF